MNKSIIIISFFVFLFLSCNSKEKSSEEINKIFESYYQESLKLYPLSATSQGDVRYNDFLPNNLSDDFRDKEKLFYNEYINYLNKFDDSLLGEEDLLSKKILLWECDRNLERLSFNEHLTPINQMWTLQLDMGQNAGGLSAQPFKTINDYNNWLKRIDDYVIWLKDAKKRMKEGVESNHVLPKSLIKKVIPQLETILNTDLETNLFYSPARQFPSSFSIDEKAILSNKVWKYGFE